jgi:phosphatidylserine/phosphatidylglycerophosphate/cardiolipin synthase-like enzyme
MPDAAPIPLGALQPAARLVVDAELLPVAKQITAAATRTVHCSYFIVDVSPYRGPARLVNDLLYELEAAHWRGVDVRVLLGGSRQNPDILEACIGGAVRLAALGVPARLLTGRAVSRTTHVKMMLADDWVLTGSHNLSGHALEDETQDSVLIASAPLAAYLRSRFEAQWLRAAPGDARPGPGSSPGG